MVALVERSNSIGGSWKSFNLEDQVFDYGFHEIDYNRSKIVTDLVNSVMKTDILKQKLKRSLVLSHKTANTQAFISSGLYTLVNKFSFSHSNLHFDRNIDERVSLQLLYKEKNIFTDK